jgi:hypothetical protein
MANVERSRSSPAPAALTVCVNSPKPLSRADGAEAHAATVTLAK